MARTFSRGAQATPLVLPQAHFETASRSIIRLGRLQPLLAHDIIISEMPSKLHLTPEEELEFQQFQQIDFWRNKIEAANVEVRSGQPGAAADGKTAELPKRWALTRNLVLHDWQSRCVDSWFAAGRRGVVKVVTGAGKTTLALAIIERLQQSIIPDLRVAIVVPTVVLLDQWHSEILAGGEFQLRQEGR